MKRQCAKCPFRRGADPHAIPGYREELHRGLRGTFAEPGEGLVPNRTLRVFACHDSVPGKDEPCAGWVHHQLGPGNNLALRLQALLHPEKWAVSVDGPQKGSFEETLPQKARP